MRASNFLLGINGLSIQTFFPSVINHCSSSSREIICFVSISFQPQDFLVCLFWVGHQKKDNFNPIYFFSLGLKMKALYGLIALLLKQKFVLSFSFLLFWKIKVSRQKTPLTNSVKRRRFENDHLSKIMKDLSKVNNSSKSRFDHTTFLKQNLCFLWVGF